MMRIKYKALVLTMVLGFIMDIGTIKVMAQDEALFKKYVKELSSKKYQGRGYAKNGVRKAGKYIAGEFRKYGVDEVTLQPFTLDINTFSGKMAMTGDGRKFRPGFDFSMREYSPGVKGEFKVYHVDTLNYNAETMFADLARPEWKNCLVACDFWFTYRHGKDFQRLQKAGQCDNGGLIYLWEAPIKYFKAYGHKVVDKPIIWVTPEAIDGIKTVTIDAPNNFLKDYESDNVIAKVSGQRHDSCYVFTAHYDHLGNLGSKVFYPGANDNASGTATVMTLAKYYAEHPAKFDIYFIAFSGEDCNLRGSTYFAEHPIVPLQQIKYLFNIDMIGDDNPALYCEVSEAGMGSYPKFEAINRDLGLFTKINRDELAANSDHYVFATRGVPCIFLENKEGSAFPYYHTPRDDFKTVRTESYAPVFRLVTAFIANN